MTICNFFDVYGEQHTDTNTCSILLFLVSQGVAKTQPHNRYT